MATLRVCARIGVSARGKLTTDLDHDPKQADPTHAASDADTHDIIVIGASAGGVAALSRLVSALPKDLPAALFVVMHIPAEPRSILPDLLSRAGPLPAHHAVHGEAIVNGHIYVAPPDNHLRVQSGYVEVVRGPKENGMRPAIDPLFHSAARAYRGRVIGVILTGGLDCGSFGLQSVKAAGGLAVVQDPTDALDPAMPGNALAHVEVDHVVTLDTIGALLTRLVRTPAPKRGEHPEPAWSRSGQTCPECHGAMTEADVNGLLLFRCHVGHAYSMESMLVQQTAAQEAALWEAVRALEESEALARRMAGRSVGDLVARFEEKARSLRQHADVVRDILLNRSRPGSSAGPIPSIADRRRSEG